MPVAAQRTGGHPAKRTFQALRIEVNHELEALERAVPAALEALNLGGRFVAMSYHSLEDKIVKRALTAEATSKAPKGFPVELEEHKPTVKIITRGAEPPTDEEIEQNSHPGRPAESTRRFLAPCRRYPQRRWLYPRILYWRIDRGEPRLHSRPLRSYPHRAFGAGHRSPAGGSPRQHRRIARR